MTSTSETEETGATPPSPNDDPSYAAGALSFSKLLVFEDSGATMSVRIPEVMSADYGMYVWPCAPVLAQYVWKNRRRIRGRRVVELGAGTALPSVVAARCGARSVTATDLDERCLANIARTAAANRVTIAARRVQWGQVTPDLRDIVADVVLVADCFYEAALYNKALATIAYLLGRGAVTADARCFAAYQERCPAHNVAHLMEKWSLACRYVPLRDFDADTGDIAQSRLPGSHTIHLMEISFLGEAFDD